MLHTRKKKSKPPSKRDLDMRKPEYKAWRKAVLARDKTCRLCNATKTLAVHHLYPYNSHPRLRYNVDNGAVLCKKHHREFHHLYGNKCTPAQFQIYLKQRRKGK